MMNCPELLPETGKGGCRYLSQSWCTSDQSRDKLESLEAPRSLTASAKEPPLDPSRTKFSRVKLSSIQTRLDGSLRDQEPSREDSPVSARSCPLHTSSRYVPVKLAFSLAVWSLIVSKRLCACKEPDTSACSCSTCMVS